MKAFWLSLGLVFVAELGDKTQLVALLLATRFKARVVLTGIFVATLAVHALSVALGGATGHLLPLSWVYFLSGLAFIGFGWWTWRGDTLDDEDKYSSRRHRSPFVIVFITFFLAELGDKTMLSTVTLAASQELAAGLVRLNSGHGDFRRSGHLVRACFGQTIAGASHQDRCGSYFYRLWSLLYYTGIDRVLGKVSACA